MYLPRKRQFHNDLVMNWVEKGDLAKLQEFFNDYPDYPIHELGINNWTPTTLACRYGHVEVLELLLEKGFKLEPEPSPHSYLQCACFSGDVAMVRHLVERHRKDVNPTMGKEQLPLRSAFKYNQYSIVEYLLTKGAYLSLDDRSAFNFSIERGFEVAATGQRSEVVRYRSKNERGDIHKDLVTIVRSESLDKRMLESLRWIRARNAIILMDYIKYARSTNYIESINGVPKILTLLKTSEKRDEDQWAKIISFL
eukprot:TRINITY_DN11359_c0_g1_i11.p1 TRINITY_DN11359_c0_g1~~TRINITY_DN11359_c0_g1_i11.p1  ORF type:complete len:253 (+),score=39.50 TRINITY_DN11359_c0_g1_i11:117-875(+)